MASSVGHLDRAAVFGDIVVYVQEVNPRRTSGKRPLTLKSWNTIKDVKQSLQTLLHVPMNKQRLFFHGRELEVSASGPGGLRELKKYSHSLQDCGIVRDGEIIYFSIAPTHCDLGQSGPVLRTYDLLTPPKRLTRNLKQVRRAWELGVNGPKLSIEGFGGTYFMYDPRKRPLACFKPADEEPYTPNNPRGKELVANWGMVGKEVFQMRPGVKPGEGYLREVASFLLDHHGFAGVPATTVIEARHKAFHHESGHEELKRGSFQDFVKHDAVVEDLSPSLFSKHEVHKIALLDLRLLNSDRNGGNILVQRKARRSSSAATAGGGSSSGPDSMPTTPGTPMAMSMSFSSNQYDYQLVPIDHGYCLPEEICIDDSLNLCWFEWKQVKEPMDYETLSYIQAMDADRDAEILRHKLGIREAALDNLKISTLLLKIAANEGLTLYDVAKIIVRETSDIPSELEQVKEAAESLAHAVTRSGLTTHCRPSLRSSATIKPPLLKTASTGGNSYTSDSSHPVVPPPRPTTAPLEGSGHTLYAPTPSRPVIDMQLNGGGSSSSSGGGGSAASSFDDAGSSLGTPIAAMHGGSHLSSPPLPITFSSSLSGGESLPRAGSGGGSIEIVGSRGGTTSLKIRLDVVEGADLDGLGYPQAHPPPKVHPRDRDHRRRTESAEEAFARTGSPASPIGFWNESLEAMNARAAKAAEEARCCLYVSGSGSSGGLPHHQTRESSVFVFPLNPSAELSEMMKRKKMMQQHARGDSASTSAASSAAALAAASGGMLGSHQPLCVPVVSKSMSSCSSACSSNSRHRGVSISDEEDDEDEEEVDDRKRVSINGSSSSSATVDGLNAAVTRLSLSTARKDSSGVGPQQDDEDEEGEEEEDDQYAWTFEMDLEHEHSTCYDEGDDLPQSGSSTESFSSSSSPSSTGIGSLSDNGQDMAMILQEVAVVADAVGKTTPSSSKKNSLHHQRVMSLRRGLAESPKATASGVVSPGNHRLHSSSSSSSSKPLVKAISSPDLKKVSRGGGSSYGLTRQGRTSSLLTEESCGGTRMSNGGGKSGCASSMSRKDQAVRESSEYRQFFFHYVNLLLHDLVSRKVKQKAMAQGSGEDRRDGRNFLDNGFRRATTAM